MTEAQIKAFLVIAEKGSIAHAAESMFVSSPAVSKHLSTLEKELGVILFERSRTGLKLTAGGRILHDYLKECVIGLQSAKEEARRANETEKLQLRVGCREEWNISAFFPAAVRDLQQHYSDVHISLGIFRDDVLLDKLMTEQLDFLITTEDAIQKKSEVVCRRLATISGGLLFSIHHPLANYHHPRLQDFADDTFFVIFTGNPTERERKYNKIKERCKSSGFNPKIATVPSVASAYSQIQYNQGVIFVAEWSMARYNPAFRFEAFNIPINICAYWINDSKSRMKQLLCEKLIYEIGCL